LSGRQAIFQWRTAASAASCSAASPATGRYLDLYRIEDNKAKLEERTVVCDSSRIDTLLALPL
jgi:hypothetical protein